MEKRREGKKEIAFENKIEQEREQLNRELGRKVGQCRQGAGRLPPFHDDVFSNTKELYFKWCFPLQK